MDSTSNFDASICRIYADLLKKHCEKAPAASVSGEHDIQLILKATIQTLQLCQPVYNEKLNNSFSAARFHITGSVLNKYGSGVLADLFLARGSALLTLFLSKASNQTTGITRMFWIDVLEKFITMHCFRSIFLADTKQILDEISVDILASHIVSFPIIISNVSEGKTNVTMEFFVTQLIGDMRDALKQSSSPYLDSVFSGIFARLSLQGHIGSDILLDQAFEKLLPEIEKEGLTDRLNSILSSVPNRSVEPLLWGLLNQSRAYCSTIVSLMPVHVSSNAKISFLLTTKFLFHRFTTDNNLLVNLFLYLDSSKEGRDLLPQILCNLLTVWGNKASMPFLSREQELHLSKAIVICITVMTSEDLDRNKSEVYSAFLPAISAHLDCVSSHSRLFGMAVAEIVTKKCSFDHTTQPENKLKFEYTDTDDTLDLKWLADKQNLSTPLKSNYECSELQNKTDPNVHVETLIEKSAPRPTNADLDSDDDLEPFDMSHDVPLENTKNPQFLRDCMLGLVDPNDHAKVEACLRNCKGLIQSSLFLLPECGVELCRILLHLRDDLPYYHELKMECIVCLVVNEPVRVAEFLGNQFYEQSFTVSQRLDILQAISQGASELSALTVSKNSIQKQSSVPSPECNVSRARLVEPSWKEILRLRAEAKTRRFASATKAPSESPNRFSPVAGSFFYPLIRFVDRKNAFMDMIQNDFLLLSRLLCCLGNVMFCATNSPVVTSMADHMFELLWHLRFHKDPVVRRSVLVAFALTVLAVPPHSLSTQFGQIIPEFTSWFTDAKDSEVDEESRILYVQASVVVAQAFKASCQTV